MQYKEHILYLIFDKQSLRFDDSFCAVFHSFMYIYSTECLSQYLFIYYIFLFAQMNCTEYGQASFCMLKHCKYSYCERACLMMITVLF